MRNKQEMVALLKETFNIKTTKEAEEYFNAFESALKQEIVESGGYKLAGVTVETVEKKASSGTSKFKGVETPWQKPAHITLKAKFSKELKDSVYKEV